MLEKEEIIATLRKVGAFQEGHFQLTSGRHSDQYIEKIKIVQHPREARILCHDLSELIQLFVDREVDLIVSPAFGAITLGSMVAEELGVDFVFANRDKNGKMMIRSGFDIKVRSKAVIVEDITTTGGSILEVIDALSIKEVDILAAALIVDRSNGKVKKEFEREFNIPLLALLTLDVPNYQPDRCPLCGREVPLTRPGSSGKK